MVERIGSPLSGNVSRASLRPRHLGRPNPGWRALVWSTGLLIRDPCDCLWYFSRPRISLCLQNEVVVHPPAAILGYFRVVSCVISTASASGNVPNVRIRVSTFEDTKVLPVKIADRFVDCTIMVIQSGLTILAQPREATHPAQRMEVAAVAFGSNGISLEKAYPLFRRSLRPVMRRAAGETCRARVAAPVAKSVRSRVS